MFRNRTDAGRRLAQQLKFLAEMEPIILALPRGGVPVAVEVARQLHAPLDIRMPHKVTSPYLPELALGAVMENGELIADRELVNDLHVGAAELERLRRVQAALVRERLSHLRPHVARRSLRGRTVVIVDDGIATGATMEAAVKMARAEGALRVIVATPVAPPSAVRRMRDVADGVVSVVTPAYFRAISEFYQDFRQVSEDEVMVLLDEIAASC